MYSSLNRICRKLVNWSSFPYFYHIAQWISLSSINYISLLFCDWLKECHMVTSYFRVHHIWKTNTVFIRVAVAYVRNQLQQLRLFDFGQHGFYGAQGATVNSTINLVMLPSASYLIDKHSYYYNTVDYVRKQLQQLQLIDFGQHEILWCTGGNSEMNYQYHLILLSFIWSFQPTVL